MTNHTHHDTISVTIDEALRAIEAGILDIPWKENPWKKIRGSLSTASRVYPHITPKDHSGTIVCDPEELKRLVASYKQTKTYPVNCGFKSYQSFYTWQSNVKRFFDHVSGRRKTRSDLKTRKDIGARLLEAISTAHDGHPLLSETETIPITTFIKLCREDNIDLDKATPDWTRNKIRTSPAGRADTIKRATALFDEFHASESVPRDVLPPQPFGDLSDVHHAGHWNTPTVHPASPRSVIATFNNC